MTPEEKSNVAVLAGCLCIIATIALCTGVGGYFGYPVGLIMFGAVMLYFAVRVLWKLRR